MVYYIIVLKHIFFVSNTLMQQRGTVAELKLLFIKILGANENGIVFG